MQVFSEVFSFLSGTPALVGPLLTAAVIFLTSNWRLSLSALLIQYILVGMALTRSVRLEIALVKILVGTLVVAMLFLSAQRIPERPADASQQEEASGPHFLGFPMGWLGGPLGLPLRFLSVLLVVLAVVRLFQSYRLTLVPMDVALVACWLGGMGLLGLVLSEDPLRVAAAVLTILTGFDLVFSRLEASLAVVGFLGAFTLVTALAFSYLIAVHSDDLGQPARFAAPLRGALDGQDATLGPAPDDGRGDGESES